MEVGTVPRRAPAGVTGALSPKLLRLASDDRLVALMRGGSTLAFEVAYGRYRRPILSFCRQLLGSADEAEDAVQHTFLAAYRDLITSKKEIHLRPWLYAIARNRCYSVLRVRREVPVAAVAEPSTEWLATEVQRRQDVRDLVADLGRLPHDQREALVLAELGALNHQQIATALGVRRERVKALVFQARESLLGLRTARETDCEEIREQLSTLHGAALRRGNLRRHLRDCPGCREFRRQIDRRPRGIGAILPIGPMLALRGGVLAASTSTQAGNAGLISTGPALRDLGLEAKGVIVALLAGVGTAGTIVAVGELPAPNLRGHSPPSLEAPRQGRPSYHGHRVSLTQRRIPAHAHGARPAEAIKAATARIDSVKIAAQPDTGRGVILRPSLDPQSPPAPPARHLTSAPTRAAVPARTAGSRPADGLLQGDVRSSLGASIALPGARISASADPAALEVGASVSRQPVTADPLEPRAVSRAVAR